MITKKLTKSEIKELKGGTICGGTSQATGDVLNKNNVDTCTCWYKNASLITNLNKAGTTCSCVCN